MKYFCLIVLVLLILSCSEDLSITNPYDTDYDLPEPENVQIEHISLTTMKVTWDYDLVNIDGFRISRKQNGVWLEDTIVAAEQNTYTEENVPVNENIQYKVIAFAGSNHSNDVVSVVIDNTIPAPESFIVAQENVHCYDLTWEQDHIVGEDGFIIERKIEDEEYSQIAILEENAESYQDDWEDARRDVNFVRYQIKAYLGEEYSSNVNTSNQIINAPTNISYERLAINRIALYWEDTSEGEQGFNIDKKVGDNDWLVNFADIKEDSTYWVNENAELNENLVYRVSAYYGEIVSESGLTGVIDNTIPRPENLLLEIINENEIRLTWEYELAGIDCFRIEKKETDGAWELYEENISPELRKWEDDSCSYLDSYRIMAYYQEYDSSYSNEVTFGIEGMTYVKGGTFEMGDHFQEGSSDELPVHDVTVSSFFIGIHEVTQGEYEASMGTNPAHNYGVGDEYPVYYVSWYDAVEYCNALSEQEGFTPCYDLSDWSCDFEANGYRLPTEAEWEYAARGGENWTDNNRYSGTTDELDDYAWYYSNSDGQSHEAGTKLANQLGIYDMTGNVWEWCNDWYTGDYYGSSPAENPSGPALGSYRVNRGGSWYFNNSYCRVANRHYYSPGFSYDSLGFRIARSSN
ncbi:MAG: formylglycine-generating enzyme family protein [Candidatus Cloacimonetes bacterium]|nr:formylglycine-generating enzyme family protein [Candidatus Cloacimonadota bacterium]